MSETSHGEPIDNLDVYEETDDGDDIEDAPIGRLAIYLDGYLRVVEADPAHETFLREAVNRVNGKSGILLRSEEPPTEQYTIGTVAVGRDDPEFPKALGQFLSTYYGLRLG